MESNNPEKKSRVEEMLQEDILAKEVFIALKAEQVVLFRRIWVSLTKLAIVISVFATLGLGFELYYLSQPSPAQKELLNDIRVAYRRLRVREDSFNREREKFYGIKTEDSTYRVAKDSITNSNTKNQ